MPPEKFVVVKTFPCFGAERIVVLASGERDAAEAGADFKRLRRGQAQHGFGQIRLQFVEHRFAPAGGNAARNAFDDAADGVARAPHFFDEPDHFFRRRLVRTTDDVRLDVLEFDLVRVYVGDEPLDLFDVGQDFDAEPFAQNFLRNRAGGDAADRFARAGAAAALPVANAVFGEISEIRVRRAEFRLHFGIGFGPGVLVFDPQTNRRAERFAAKRAGKNLHRVGFLARRNNFGLSGPAPVQIGLNVRLGEPEARRAAVHDHTHATAVGFAPRRDAEQLPEGACHAGIMLKKRFGQCTHPRFLDGADYIRQLRILRKSAYLRRFQLET